MVYIKVFKNYSYMKISKIIIFIKYVLLNEKVGVNILGESPCIKI